MDCGGAGLRDSVLELPDPCPQSRNGGHSMSERTDAVEAILERYRQNADGVSDERFMSCALELAEAAGRMGEVPVGAVVVCRDRIIARSHNLTETLTDVTAHAEMQAITAAANYLGGKYLSDCTLYVTVEPCVMCAGAIAWSQMGSLVFGAADEKRGYQRYAPQALHPKTNVRQGVLADDCALLMKDFFKKRR